jgi:HEAT repeat protein
VIILPEELHSYSAYDLLNGASRAMVAIDQRWVHALVDHPEKTLPGILRFADENHAVDPIPLTQDLISIFHYLKEPRGIPFLIELMRDDPLEISDEIVEALVGIGQPAIDPLLDLYAEVGPENGGEIAFILAGMGIKDPRILEILLGRLDGPGDDSLFHLEVYGDPAAIPELEKRLQEAEGEETLDLRDTIEDLREPKPPTHVPDLDIWEFYPETDLPEYDLATEADRLELLTSPIAEQRTQVAATFFGHDFSAAARAKLLDLAQHDPSPAARGRAWSVFYDSTDDPELRLSMMERFGNTETPKRERAGLAVGLARHTDQPWIHQGIEELAKDPETRELAVEAMWRSFDPSFGPLAVSFHDDPDIEVRRNVIWAIGYLDQTSQVGLLRRFFDEEALRPDALHNYALAAPGPTTRKKMEALLVKIKDLADGLTEGEEAAVRAGLDLRLSREGLAAYFSEDADPEPEPEPARVVKVGRNDPCPCGSGKKYKKCCGQ